jgi:hypothetical protein
MQTDPNWANFLYDPVRDRLGLIDFGASREYTKEFMDGWFRLLSASLRGDREVMREASEEIGYLTGEENDVSHLTGRRWCSALIETTDDATSASRLDGARRLPIRPFGSIRLFQPDHHRVGPGAHPRDATAPIDTSPTRNVLAQQEAERGVLDVCEAWGEGGLRKALGGIRCRVRG